MNYQQVKVNRGVKFFKAQERNELTLTNDGLFFNGEKIDERVETFSLSNDRLIFIKGDTTFMFRKRGMEFEEETRVNKVIIHQTATANDAIFTSELSLEDFTLKYELIDFETKTTVFDFGRLPISEGIFRDSKSIFLHLENRLTCFNPYSQKSAWELELETRVKIEKLFGVYRNQLLVACSDHLLISVDVNTGVVVRRWRELPGFDAGQPYKNVLPEPTNFVLDKSIGKLIGAFDIYYFEIDIESGECLYTPLKDELTKFGISDFRSFNNNPFTESHLFLTAHTYLSEFPNVDLSSVLALNRRTKKVDWIHVFKGSGLGTNVPQITSTYLYQLDTENNLHIFERVS